MIDREHPFKIKVLMVYEGINGNNATSRAVRTLKEELENQDVKVVVSESLANAGGAYQRRSRQFSACCLSWTRKARPAVSMPERFWRFCGSGIRICRCFCFLAVRWHRRSRQTFLTRLTILSGFWKTPLILSPAEFWPQPNVTASLSCRRCLRLWPSLPRCTSIRGIHPAIPAERLF